MYRGTPAQFFFQCVNLVIFKQGLLRGALQNLLSVGLHSGISHFKQLIGNLGLLCAFKMCGCWNSHGSM